MTLYQGSRAFFVIVAVLMAVAGCGISPDQAPSDVDLRVDPTIPLGTPASPSDGDDRVEVRADVYFVSDDQHVVPVVRSVGGVEPVAQISEVVRMLIEGPDPKEASSGLRSAVPSTTSILGVTLDDGMASIDLTDAFASVGGREELLAVGQLVLTVTSITDVDQLSIELNGRPIAVPLPDGALTDAPVSMPQYTSLLDCPSEATVDPED